MKIRNLQSLLVCPIILWRISSTEDDWIFGWWPRLASRILTWCLAFTHHMWWCVFRHVRNPRIESSGIRWYMLVSKSFRWSPRPCTSICRGMCFSYITISVSAGEQFSFKLFVIACVSACCTPDCCGWWLRNLFFIVEVPHRWTARGARLLQKAHVETGEEGFRVAAAVRRDEHEKAITEDRAKFEQNDLMEVNETKQTSWSEDEKNSAAYLVHKRLLEPYRIWWTEWKGKSHMNASRDRV